MPDPGRYSVNLDVTAGRDRQPAAPLPDDPFRIALLGDFRGRSATSATDDSLADRRAVAVDRDDVDEVLARFQPRLSLDLGGTTVDLAFAELDDFHPDRIFQRAAFFRALREARTRLSSVETFSGTLEEILGAPIETRRPGPDVEAEDVIADTLSGSLLDRITGAPGQREDPLKAFLRRIVAPHVVPGEDPRRDAMLRDLDASVGRLMREVFHHPRFQALESLWRSVDFLVRRVETGPSLKLSLIDATADELQSVSEAGDDALAGTLRRLAGDADWSALVVDHRFGAEPHDLQLLRDLAAAGSGLGAAVLSGARADLIGLRSFETLPDARDVAAWQDDAWHAFRRSPDAAFVGLVLPRFLLRLPYGESGEPCERIRFEELDVPPDHSHYLWGNGAIAAAVLLADAFAQSGWRMRPGQQLDVPGLPIHTWRAGGETELKPCAECLMTDRLAEALLEAGPMVLATIRHGDTARLVRFQSLASPPRALQGPWSRVS